MKSYTLRLALVSDALCLASNPAYAENPAAAECNAGLAVSDEMIESPNRPEQAVFEDYFRQASCYVDQAASAGSLWIKTEELLARSATEAGAGDWSAAIRTAKETRFQAKTAVQQAEDEKAAWQRRIIRNKPADKP